MKGSEREKRGARGSIQLAETGHLGDRTPIPVQIQKESVNKQMTIGPIIQIYGYWPNWKVLVLLTE